jgi:hypothetical protein
VVSFHLSVANRGGGNLKTEQWNRKKILRYINQENTVEVVDVCNPSYSGGGDWEDHGGMCPAT